MSLPYQKESGIVRTSWHFPITCISWEFLGIPSYYGKCGAQISILYLSYHIVSASLIQIEAWNAKDVLGFWKMWGSHVRNINIVLIVSHCIRKSYLKSSLEVRTLRKSLDFPG